MAFRLEADDDLGEKHDINVTPFIDVMLVLLIIFMIAAPLSTVEVAVNLPASTAAPKPSPAKPVTLTLKPDGALLVDGNPTARDDLAAALDRASAGDREKHMLLGADKTLAYGEVMALMNALRSAGYTKVGLIGIESDRR